MATKQAGNIIHSEGHMVMALKAHFHSPEYVLIPQVRNGAGFDATRTADALAMSLWPSRGLHLFGIEIKVSRGDWMREMKNPKKVDAIGKFCDFWFVAAGSEGIVKDGELPPGWGLLVPGKKPSTLKVAVAPTRIEHVEPMSRSFMAAIFKRAFEAKVGVADVEDEINRRVSEELTRVREKVQEQALKAIDTGNLVKRNAELEAAVKAFEGASGCYIGHSVGQATKYGRAMKLVGWDGFEGMLKRMEEAQRRNASELSKILASLPAGEPSEEQLVL